MDFRHQLLSGNYPMICIKTEILDEICNIDDKQNYYDNIYK